MSGMDFKGAQKRVRGLLAAQQQKRPLDRPRSGLTEDQLRDNVIDESAAGSERFRKHLERRPTVEYEHEAEDGTKEAKSFEWSTYDEMVRDVARANFGYDEPQIRQRGEVRPSHEFNREVLSSLIASEGWQEQRPYTRGNEMQSIYGAMAASKALQDHASEVAEHLARSEEMGEAEQQQQSAQDMLDNLRKRAKKQHDATGQVDPKLVKKMKAQTGKRQQARAKLSQLQQQQAQSNYVQAASAIAQKAGKAAAGAANALGSLPGVEAGTAQNLPLDAQIELAEKWAATPDLQAISRMLGRMVRDMRFKREARTKNVKIEPVGIEAGDDIQRLLPQEYARAYSDHPLVKATFVKDFAQKSLLQYEMHGKEPAGKGPIICVQDGSGSMGGEPFVWASSVTLSLLTMAARDKRDFAAVEFGSSHELKSWFFPRAEPIDSDEVLDVATHFFGGGTSIHTGMAEAHRIVHDVAAFKTADVVLISDGQDHFRDDDKRIRDELRALGVRIHGISILCPDNAYCEQMCEWTCDVTDLAGANNATDGLAESIT